MTCTYTPARSSSATCLAANAAGCVLVISHAPLFLDLIATHILACEGAKPKRIRYKPISR